MNSSTIAICLYSKYSQRCKEFLDAADNGMIRMLCIDNKDVRRRITNDTNGYHVRTVPCVFVLFSNGRLEKHEGSDAFVWLRKLQEAMNPPPPPPQRPIMLSPLFSPPPQQPQEEDIKRPPPQPQEEEERPMEKSAEQVIEDETSARQATDQVITRKTLNIKEMAQLMQQQRENDEEKTNPPPPGSPGSNNRF